MKSAGVAYLLWLFSVHRFYLGRPLSAVLYLCTIGGLGVWALLDLLLIPGMVDKENAKLGRLMRGGDQMVNVTVRPGSGKRRRYRDDDDDDYDDRPRRPRR